MERCNDQQLLQNFRMRKATFLKLCAWLAPALWRCDTHLQLAIPLEKWVAIDLSKLATPDSYQSVGNRLMWGSPPSGLSSWR